MDWTTSLRSQQADFIQRLKSNCLFHCETQGQHSELTVISDKNLSSLRCHCRNMTNKFKDRCNDVFEVYLNHLKGKLGEKVVKLRLDTLITEIDYENLLGGDGKVDFRLNSDPSIGIQVKSRHGSIDTVRWSISKEEVEKNAALVCILIQEEVNEAQTEYNLIMAGFLPTNRIELSNGEASVGINKLLYSGGLRSYLKSSNFSETNDFQLQEIQTLKPKEEREKPLDQNKYQYIEYHSLNPAFDYFGIGNSYYDEGDYQGAVTNYNYVLQLNPNFVGIYLLRGNARLAIQDIQGAIEDFSQQLRINAKDDRAYYGRGLARAAIGDNLSAIKDYTQAIKINPNHAEFYYYFLGIAYYSIGDAQRAVEAFSQELSINPNEIVYFRRGIARVTKQDNLGAIKDYTQAIKINPNRAEFYFERGVARAATADDLGAIEDYIQVINIEPKRAEAYENLGAVSFNTGSKCFAINNLQKAAELYRQKGKQADYQRAVDVIKIIQLGIQFE